MDTWGLLGQALECSVCLEQLDSTSRVLPCQHTFCRKCLIDIINSRKELRCPECRVLVTVPFNSLPPNILLLRILEGIKSFPPKTSATATTSVSESLLDVSSQKSSQLHKSSDPFSIFSQFPASNESAIQTSSNRNLSGNVHTSTNPFLEPHSNACASVTNIQVVPSLNNSAQTNSIISNTDPLRYTTAVVNSSLNVLSPLQGIGSQENTHDQLLTNIACPSAQIISSVLSSSHTLNNLGRQNINLNSDGNSQPQECNISLSSSSQAVSPSIIPTPVSAPVLSLSDYIAIRRTNVNTQTQREPLSLTSNISHNSAIESQSLETSESPHVIKIKSEESSVVNVRTSLGSQLPLKSHRESQLTSISSQSFVSHSLNVQAKALYNYNGKEARDLKFKKGDVIKLFKQIDENWYQGELDGQVGIVPASYVKFIDPTSSHLPQCKALYDFKMPMEEERNCLMFSKGDMITILRRVDENWAEGKLNTLIGIFPLSFVELNEAAKNLIRISSSVTSMASHLHYHHHQTAAGSLSTTVSSSTHTPIPSVLTPVPVHASTPQSVQASNHSTQSINQGTLPLKDLQGMNRLSGTQTSTNASPSRSSSITSDGLKRTESSRLHSQIDSDVTRSLPSHQLYVALYSYRPRKADELELTKGFLYSVADKCLDGWFKGRCLATDKIGVFPGNYVQLANAEAIAGAHYPKSMTASIASYLSEIHGINFAGGNNKFKTSTAPRTHSQTGSLGDVRNLSIGVACPPELPPRSLTSSNKTMGASSTGERPSSASDSSPRFSSCSSPVSQAGQQADKKSATKDRSGTTNGSGISLMRKFTNSGKRKTKSPPFLSVDNPVFEEAPNKSKNIFTEDKSCNGVAKTVKQMPAPLIRERYRCVTPYPANSEYELELQVGDIVYIHKKRDDGWFKGTLQRTGKTGLFPSIFVELC